MDRERIRHVVAPFLGAFFLITLLAVIPAKLMSLNKQWELPALKGPSLQVMGILLMLAGTGTFVYCSKLFRRVGRGTPVPTDPPTELVASGLYLYSRNPIYIGYVIFLFGEFFFFGQLILLFYAIVTFLGAHVAVVLLEEPPLRRKFGNAYLEYTKQVPRWFCIRRGRQTRE